MRAVAAALMLVFLLSVATAGEGKSVELQDRAALEFQAQTLDGGELQLSSLKGKVVLLNFWGIWCIPCRKEIPKLQAMYEELRTQGLEIVGIDVGDEADMARKYVAQQSMSYPVLLGEEIAGDYDVEVFPTNVIIDRAGRIRHVEEGYDEGTTDVLRDIIEVLLAQQPAGTGDKP
jgi:thiol-disulfide isomerase/thioredoxin